MNKFASAQRSIVTVDDRRAAFVAAKGRKPRDIVNVPTKHSSATC